jgi:TM2 domain-containing membrane protein YozV|uniref:TM2 domain-containing protein n=1 Tax=Flavobacterium sp. TaxID=239 RepID=UPI00404B8A60|tara:strand:+ start:437 stop:766 length:330 start_codon:yes stop_codon:yes gene_type:complete
MRLKLLMPALFFLLTFSTVEASFPVKRTTTTEVSTTISENSDYLTPAAAAAGYDKWVAVAFWFFLGAFAAHRWYAKKPAGWNILFILTLGGLFVWAVIDLVNILTDNFN